MKSGNSVYSPKKKKKCGSTALEAAKASVNPDKKYCRLGRYRAGLNIANKRVVEKWGSQTVLRNVQGSYSK